MEFHTHESTKLGRIEHSHLGGEIHAHYHNKKYGSPVWFCGCPLDGEGQRPTPIAHCPNRKDD